MTHALPPSFPVEGVQREPGAFHDGGHDGNRHEGIRLMERLGRNLCGLMVPDLVLPSFKNISDGFLGINCRLSSRHSKTNIVTLPLVCGCDGLFNQLNIYLMILVFEDLPLRKKTSGKAYSTTMNLN